jgi:hypothetical protein
MGGWGSSGFRREAKPAILAANLAALALFSLTALAPVQAQNLVAPQSATGSA